MRYLMTAAVLVLVASGAAALPAAADDGMRERAAWERSEGRRLHEGRAEHRERQHLGYAAEKESYEARPRRHHPHSATHHRRTVRHKVHHRSFAHHRRGGHRVARRAAPRHAALHGMPSHGVPSHRAAPASPHRTLGSSSAHDGVASFYSEPQRVASGGWFNPNALTAAHRSLPFGTRVRVTHKGTGRSVDVTINDRGPYIAGRIIDLSRAAAGVIGMTAQGIARVTVEVLGR